MTDAKGASASPNIVSRKVIHRGTAVAFHELVWCGVDGTKRVWESAERVNDRGAVVMIPRLMPSRRLVLIRQYRPPAEGVVIEFPAGLIDAGESPETAAFRELAEETGYHGVIVSETPPTFNSPGLSSETVYQFVMDIEETRPENVSPQTRHEGSEHIEVLLAPLGGITEFLDRQFAAGVHVDSKVASYVLGLSHA